MLRKFLSKLLGSKKKSRSKSKKSQKSPKSLQRLKKNKAKKSAPKKKPAARKAVKKPPVKHPSAKARKPVAPHYGKELGEVVAFFRIPVVAVIQVTAPSLKVGDAIWIKGHTTDIKMTVASMQVNHQNIAEAKKGDEVGIKVTGRTRRGDRVYRLPV